jgi:glycosyltransferase involved in cell wall biosynthesis
VKVSVIIPVKNRASLLPMTLDNILHQEHSPHEVLVVDDGSEDNLSEVKERYQDRVRFLSSKGRGPGAARNEGLRVATGDAIQFFDSDDLMTKNKLRVQSSLMELNPDIDLVYGPYVRAQYSSGGWKPLDAILQYEPLPKKPLHILVLEGWCSLTQSCLFRRQAVDRAGLWREDLMPHEDKEYWYRLAKAIKGSLHENKSCVFYRQHQQQITDQHVKNVPRTLDAVKALEIIIAAAKKDGAPVFSRLLCEGAKAGHVRYLNNNNHPEIRNSYFDLFSFYFLRAVHKIGKMKTKTNWQPYLGPLDSRDKFEEYRAMI